MGAQSTAWASEAAYDTAAAEPGPSAYLPSKAETSTCLLDLPASALTQVAGCLLPITQRQLRLTCKLLKQAVDVQITRLVIDGPTVSPAPFPSLCDVTVVLWRANTDELDLLPLLCRLPRMHHLRSLRIKCKRDSTSACVATPHGSGAGEGSPMRHEPVTAAGAGVPMALRVLGRCVGPATQVVPSVVDEPPSLAHDTLDTIMTLLSCAHKPSTASATTLWCPSIHGRYAASPVKVFLDAQVVPDMMTCNHDALGDANAIPTNPICKQRLTSIRQQLRQATKQQIGHQLTVHHPPACQLFLQKPLRVALSQDVAGLLHAYTGLTELRLDLPAPAPPAAPQQAAAPPIPPTHLPKGFDLKPLAALTSLQKLRLNWLRNEPAKAAVPDQAARPEGLECLTKGLANSLTSFEVLGMVQLKIADVEYIGHLTQLTSLTLWHEGWVTGSGLQALATCTALTQLQVARVDLYAAMPDAIVPLSQVKELSAHTMQGAPLLCDILPGLVQVTLHDWPGTCSPGLLTGLSDHGDASSDHADKEKLTATSLEKLVMVQYTSCLHTTAWGNLSRRINANLKGVTQLQQLQSISFYHFTHLNTVRQLCQAASQLPCLKQLTLVASNTGIVFGTERAANTFGGLTQLKSLTIDCEMCGWDVMSDLLLIKPPNQHSCSKAASNTQHSTMALSALWLASLKQPVSCKQMAALLARLPQLVHVELVGCKGADHQLLLLPQQLGRPDLRCVVHSAPVHDVAPGMRSEGGVGHAKRGASRSMAGGMNRAMSSMQAAVIHCKERLGLQPARF